MVDKQHAQPPAPNTNETDKKGSVSERQPGSDISYALEKIFDNPAHNIGKDTKPAGAEGFINTKPGKGRG